MKFFLIIEMIILGFQSEAQNYFNKRFNDGSAGENGLSLQVMNDTISIAFTSFYFDGVDNLVSAGLLQLDYSGNLIDTDFYSFTKVWTYSGGPQSINKTNSTFIIGGSYKDSIQVDALLIKINSKGDTIFTKRYGDSAFQSGWMARQISDGNYIICGSTATVDTFGNVLLIKSDSIGNILWQNDYGYFGSQEIAFAFTQTSDGGYALIGWRYYSGSLYDIYLLKIDSGGNFQWDTTYGSQWPEEAWSVVSTQDGNIVIAGAYAYGIGNNRSPYMAKFDLYGNMLWEKKYAFGGGFGGGTLYSVRELSDGSLIATGDDDSPPYPPYNKALILKTTVNGDSLWYKKYYSSFNGISYLRDISPTPDGGFVACGFVNPQAPDTGHQDLWVLKVDSVGCEISNCMVGINEYLENKISVSVYPNPFINELNIDFDLPDKQFELRMFNILGEEVFNCRLPEKSNSLNVNLNEGLFLMQIFKDERLVYSGKVCRLIR